LFPGYFRLKFMWIHLQHPFYRPRWATSMRIQCRRLLWFRADLLFLKIAVPFVHSQFQLWINLLLGKDFVTVPAYTLISLCRKLLDLMVVSMV
jgi:hypothetical protein